MATNKKIKEKEVNNISEPLFFLFTCVKNGRKYIEKLFDSLLSQTKINFVHYIYEDGSDDPIMDLVDDYKNKSSKLSNSFEIIYEFNPINIGLNMATKHCINKCYLPYFIWIDCDNWVGTTFFENLEKVVKKHKKAILYRTNFIGYDENGKQIYELNKKIAKKNNQNKSFLYNKFPYSFFAVDFKKYMKISNNVFINDRLFFNDDQVICNCFFNGLNTSFSSDSYSFFTVRSTSESNSSLKLKDDSYDYNMYKKLAVVQKKDKFYFVNRMFEVKNCFNDMIRALNQNKYNEAYCLLKKKREICKKYSIPRIYRNFYGNDFWWFTCIKFPFVRKLVRLLRGIKSE